MEDNPRRRIRADSKIMRLPPDVREQVDEALRDPGISFVTISEWLKEEGYDISKSAVGRYALNIRKAAQHIVETLEKMKVIVKAVESSPDVDYTKASRIVAMDGLLQRVISAEEEFMDLPLDRAISLIASLTNTEIHDRRTKQIGKSKMELAFDNMEEKLNDAIKSNPEIAKEFRSVMRRARQELFPVE